MTDPDNMLPLPDAIARVIDGWSPHNEISIRAALMRCHAEAGNVERAEEYAVEIEALQSAMYEGQGKRWGAAFGPKPRVMPEWAASEWMISHARWAAMLTHGYLCTRRVWAAKGWTAENVAGEAQRVQPFSRVTAADMIPPRGLLVECAA